MTLNDIEQFQQFASKQLARTSYSDKLKSKSERYREGWNDAWLALKSFLHSKRLDLEKKENKTV